jgi:hypothetical protein
LPPHQHRECAEVILMRMRHDDRIHVAISERCEIRQGRLAFRLRVHAAVEDETLLATLEVIAIRADLGATREVDELHGGAALDYGRRDDNRRIASSVFFGPEEKGRDDGNPECAQRQDPGNPDVPA